MQNMIPFSFESREIRVVIIGEQPMFSARDVALALGYSNPSEAYSDHCKYLKLLSYSELLELNWVNPNPRGEYVIPESDVYRLIVKSNKPEAERFERWVFEDVLPSIRKTGEYSQSINQTKLDIDRLALAREAYNTAKLFGFDGNMAVLSADNYVRNTTGVGVLANMGATHLIADPNGNVYTPTELGKLIKPTVSAIKFNLMLEAAGLQKRELDQWVPCDKAKGLYEWLDTNKKYVNGAPVKQMKWFKRVIDLIS